jgi:hypothetical protein
MLLSWEGNASEPHWFACIRRAVAGPERHAEEQAGVVSGLSPSRHRCTNGTRADPGSDEPRDPLQVLSLVAFPAVAVYRSPTDRKRLPAIVDDRNSPHRSTSGAPDALATAAGLGTATIMRTAGVSKTAVWRWQERFMSEGVDGPATRQDAAGADRQIMTTEMKPLS